MEPERISLRAIVHCCLPLDLSTPLMYVKGVGPARAEFLKTKGLLTVEDLLGYVPFRYEDRSNVKTIAQLSPGEMATVLVEVKSAKLAGFRRRSLGLFEVVFTDGSSERLVGKWFHGAYLEDRMKPGVRMALYGKVELDSYTGDLLIMHPEFEVLSGEDDGDAALHTGRVVPIYEAAGKITTRVFRNLIHRVLDTLAPVSDPMPQEILARLKLPDRWSSVRDVHFP